MHFLNSLIKKKKLKQTLAMSLALAGITVGSVFTPTTNHSVQAVSSKNAWSPFTYYNAGKGPTISNYLQRRRGITGFPIGGSSSKWATVHITTGDGSDGFKYYPTTGQQSNGPGMYYKDAVWYYPDTNVSKKRYKLDVQIRLTNWAIDWSNTSMWHKYKNDKGYVVFHKNGLSVSHGSEGFAQYHVSFYKDGKPFKIPSRYLMTFWDIDYGQSIGLGPDNLTIIGASGHTNKSYYTLDPGKYGNSKYSLFGTYSNRHHWKTIHGDQGSVLDTDHYGGMTWNLKPQYDKAKTTGVDVSYGFEGTDAVNNFVTSKDTDRKPSASAVAKGKEIKVTKKAPNQDTPGNYFTIDFRDNNLPPIKPFTDKTKFVNNKKDLSGKAWPTTLKNLKYDAKDPAKTQFYYRFMAISRFPDTKGKPIKGGNPDPVIENLTFQDTLSPGLTIDKIEMYTQDSKTGKLKKAGSNVTKYFTGLSKPKGNKIDVHLTKTAINSLTIDNWDKTANSWLFNHRINLIVHVKGNKKLVSAFTKKIDDHTYEAKLTNVASIITDYGKQKTNKAYTYIRITNPKQNMPFDATHGQKFVYRMKEGTLPKDSGSVEQNYILLKKLIAV